MIAHVIALNARKESNTKLDPMQMPPVLLGLMNDGQDDSTTLMVSTLLIKHTTKPQDHYLPEV